MFGKRKNKEKLSNNTPKIIVGQKTGESESYYRLKDNILYYSDSGKNKVFQIESAISGEGKSTVIINLAVALANSGKKVALLDLDFRRPQIHRSFEIVNVNGIAEYMLNECSKEELIKHTTYGVDVINRGKATQNASIIFTSDKFKELIDDLREEYDVVLFDCPPILMVSDYIHISKLSDAVIYVVCAGVTLRNHLKEAIELLKRNNVKILGTVLTYKNLRKVSSRYGRYYGNRYYRSVKDNYMDL